MGRDGGMNGQLQQQQQHYQGVGQSSRRGMPSPSCAGSPSPPGGVAGGAIDAPLRRWLCLCLAKLCWRYRDAQDACVRDRVQESLFGCLVGKGVGFETCMYTFSSFLLF